MTRNVLVLWLFLLIAASALAQDSLPAKILYNGKECVIFNLQQVRLINSMGLRLDECKETNDSLHSILDKSDSLVKVKIAKIAQYEIQVQKQDSMLMHDDTMISNDSVLFNIQERKLGWANKKANVSTCAAILAVLYETLKYIKVIK